MFWGARSFPDDFPPWKDWTEFPLYHAIVQDLETFQKKLLNTSASPYQCSSELTQQLRLYRQNCAFLTRVIHKTKNTVQHIVAFLQLDFPLEDVISWFKNVTTPETIECYFSLSGFLLDREDGLVEVQTELAQVKSPCSISKEEPAEETQELAQDQNHCSSSPKGRRTSKTLPKVISSTGRRKSTIRPSHRSTSSRPFLTWGVK